MFNNAEIYSEMFSTHFGRSELSSLQMNMTMNRVVSKQNS